MTRLTMIRSLCLLCLISGSVMSSTANAQSGLSRFDRGFDRPTVSPYVNLLRGGGNVGLNYFGVVRPQQQFVDQSQQLNQQLQTVNRRTQSQRFRSRTQGPLVQQVRVGSTGHAVSFLTIGGGVVGRGGQSNQGLGQNLMLSGFGNAGGGGTTGFSPGFGGDSSANGGGFGGGNFGGGGGGGFSGGGFGGGGQIGGGGIGSSFSNSSFGGGGAFSSGLSGLTSGF